MHRDVVTHVAVSAADFFITGSIDGKAKILFLSLKFFNKSVISFMYISYFLHMLHCWFIIIDSFGRYWSWNRFFGLSSRDVLSFDFPSFTELIVFFKIVLTSQIEPTAVCIRGNLLLTCFSVPWYDQWGTPLALGASSCGIVFYRMGSNRRLWLGFLFSFSCKLATGFSSYILGFYNL